VEFSESIDLVSASGVSSDLIHYKGIHHGPTADHYAARRGKLRCYDPVLHCHNDISIVDNGTRALPVDCTKPTEIHGAFIELGCGPRMHDKSVERIPVQNRQQPKGFVGIGKAQTYFHRNSARSPWHYEIQKLSNTIHLWKKTRAPVFAGDRTKGASQVPINMCMPEGGCDEFSHSQKILRIISDELGNNGQFTFVFREYFTKMRHRGSVTGNCCNKW